MGIPTVQLTVVVKTQTELQNLCPRLNGDCYIQLDPDAGLSKDLDQTG